MRKILIPVLLLSILASKNIYSQDKTYGAKNSLIVSDDAQKTGAIVPMMDKMFLSNVTHEIGKYNQMDFREVRSFFIGYINDMAALTSLSQCSLKPLGEIHDSLILNVQVATGYDFDLITKHSKSDETKIQQFWSQFQKKIEDSSTKRGAYLENGEIKEFYDGKSRFMNANVDTAWVFNKVLADQDLDYVLFINELDIHKPRPTDPNYGSNERTLKLHFTLYSGEGKRLYGNAAFSTFAADKLDIYQIANDALFSAINRMMAECSAHLTTLSELKK